MFCFVVYYLGHYPEVKQRLRQELDTVLGKDLTKPVTAKDLDELHYCDAIIKEVTRFCPVVFALSRMNLEKDEIGGFSWPEKTSFRILYSAMMKREDYWTDPEKFDPDRFYKVDESDKYIPEKKKAKNVLPIFGGGIRMCPGRKLAMIELKCLLSLIYRKYDIEMVDMNAPLKCKYAHIILCDELIVKIKPRKF